MKFFLTFIFKPTGKNVDYFMMSVFKEMTLFRNLTEREPVKCQTLIDAMKSAFDKYKVFLKLILYIT